MLLCDIIICTGLNEAARRQEKEWQISYFLIRKAELKFFGGGDKAFMYKQCSTLQSSERQKEFQHMLLQMMQKKTFQEITVTALCEKIGAPRKAFYRYFDCMEDVLNAHMDEILVSAFIHIEICPELESFFEYWKEQKEFLDVLEKNNLSYKMMERSYALFPSEGNEGALSVINMQQVGFVMAILMMVLIWHHGGMQQSAEEMKEQLLEMFGKGLEKITKA